LPGFLFNLVNSGFLAVADINNDSINDIVVAPYSPGNSYRVVTGRGKFLDAFSLIASRYTHAYTYASPLILDLNGDGGIDIVGTENDSDGVNVTGYLFVWSSDAPYNPSLRGWPKFHYDPQNTGMVPVTR
jgi:hypothetical protein